MINVPYPVFSNAQGNKQVTGSGAKESVLVSLTDGSEDIGGLSTRTGKLLWRGPLPFNGVVIDVDAKTGTIVSWTVGGTGPGDTAGISPKGNLLWSHKGMTFCSVRNGQVNGTANNQFVTVDAVTGKQVSYSAEKGCPQIIGDLVVSADDAGAGLGLSMAPAP